MGKAIPDEERGARSLLHRETSAHPAMFSRVKPLRLRSAPLLLLAVCFAAGVLCKPWWQPTHDMVFLCILLLLTAWAAWRWAPRLAWVTTAICWVALGWTSASFEQTAVDGSLLHYADELQRSFDGRVVAIKQLPPHVRPIEETAAWRDVHGDEENAFAAIDHASSGSSYSMDLQANAIEDVTPDVSRMVVIAGGVQITMFSRSGAAFTPPPCGAHVLLNVRLHPPHRYNDPGVWQYAETLAQRGISVESSVDAASMHVLDTTGASWQCRFSAAQHWSTNRLAKLAQSPLFTRVPPAFRFGSEDAAILSAMLFGDRTQLDRGLRQSFERTGSFHLFVVAGAHIAIVLAVLYGGLLRLRVPRWIAALSALSAATAYAMMTGFGAPVQRALLMATVYLLTECLSRERNALNAIGAAALAMLMVHPHALLESSFQMTLLAAFAIAGVAVPLGERTLMPYARALRNLDAVRNDPNFSPRLAQFRVSLRWFGDPAGRRRSATPTRWEAFKQTLPATVMRVALFACELVLITFIAELVMALPMAVYFHRVTPFAGPANLLALPMLAVLMACAVATFLASLLHPIVALVPAMLTALLLHGITYIIGTLGSLHGADVRTPAPLLASITVALLLWAATLFLLRLPARRTGLIACALIPLTLFVVLWPRRPELHRDRLEFTAIDVGQGDSLLVGSPNGRAMLIDAGGPTGSAALTDQTNFDTGEEVVSPYLWSRGIRRLDVAVLTHAHSDHIGGMASVLRNFRPRELWVSVDADTPPFLALLRIARQNGTVVRHLHAGDRVAWNGAAVQVLGPAVDYKPHSLPTNDDSLALRIAYGRASVQAEGDAEHASEQAIADTHPQPVTLLKVGHHGSNTSTSQTLLDALHPCFAVISCGLGNRFGHPRLQVLQRLQAAGIRTTRTDEMGAVQYLLRSDGSIETHVIASNP